MIPKGQVQNQVIWALILMKVLSNGSFSRGRKTLIKGLWLSKIVWCHIGLMKILRLLCISKFKILTISVLLTCSIVYHQEPKFQCINQTTQEPCKGTKKQIAKSKNWKRPFGTPKIRRPIKAKIPEICQFEKKSKLSSKLNKKISLKKTWN